MAVGDAQRRSLAGDRFTKGDDTPFDATASETSTEAKALTMVTPPPSPAGSSFAENADVLPCIYGVSDRVAQLDKLDDIFEYIASAATRLTQSDAAAIHIFDFTSGMLQLAWKTGAVQGRQPQAVVRVGQGLLGSVVKSGHPYGPGMTSPNNNDTAQQLEDLAEFGAVLCAPMNARGRSFGCITVSRDGSQPYGERDLLLLNILAAEAVHAAEKARLARELRAQATMDPLTGLLNEGALMQKLAPEVARSQRRHQPLSVLLVDVDDLAGYNDAHGALMGDKLLHDLTRVLCSHCRKIDFVGRLGGDEFIIVAPQTDIGGALALSDKIQTALGRFAFLSSHAAEPYHATCCIGIASFPEHGVSAEELVDNARRALETSQHRGKNRTSAWSRSL